MCVRARACVERAVGVWRGAVVSFNHQKLIHFFGKVNVRKWYDPDGSATSVFLLCV